MSEKATIKLAHVGSTTFFAEIQDGVVDLYAKVEGLLLEGQMRQIGVKLVFEDVDIFKAMLREVLAELAPKSTPKRKAKR